MPEVAPLKFKIEDPKTHTSENVLEIIRDWVDRKCTPHLRALADIRADTDGGTFAKLEIFAALVMIQSVFNSLDEAKKATQPQE